jgi:hypothetical protein
MKLLAQDSDFELQKRFIALDELFEKIFQTIIFLLSQLRNH